MEDGSSGSGRTHAPRIRAGVDENVISELMDMDPFVSKRSSELAATDIRWNCVNASDNSCFLKERMMQALRYIKESRGRDVLAQVWVPIRKGGKWVLTTSGQPFVIDPASDKLTHFRTVSLNYNFPAEEDSEELPGLPGRVFLRKMPEWTPDVQFYSRKEYLRLLHAQHYDVRGTLAVPVFESDNQSCVGVMELITTTSKIRYGSEFENICRALQAVNLRSSDNTSEHKHRELDISQTNIDNITAGSLGEGSFSSPSSHDDANIRGGLEKKRGKVEKNISLAVLQQYFAGSLKDAAKSIDGFQWHKQWLIVDSRSRAYIESIESKLALVEVILPKETLVENWQPTASSFLTVKAPGMVPLDIPLLRKAQMKVNDISVWEWSGSAFDEGDEAAAWFSRYLDKSVRLVQFDTSSS